MSASGLGTVIAVFWRSVRVAAAACALASLAANPALAQGRDRPADFSALAERLMPAVVNIATRSRVDGLDPGGRGSRGSPLERFNDSFGGDPLQEANSLGSGFLISADGVIVTNSHVIEGADEIEVILHDGERLPAALVGRDAATDLAVLRIEAGRPLASVPWGESDAARVGEWVIAIGNPFGLGGSVSAGIISARNRDIAAGRFDDFLQTDAAINRGNSGGPLFNLAGEVIGVNTAIVSPTGASVGVGFATPSGLARGVVAQILEFGEARRGWLGVRLGVLTPAVAARAGLDRPIGALIAAVNDDGPAAVGGLRPGDIVLSFGGEAAPDGRTLSRMVAERSEGEEVVVEFLRGARRMTTTVTIERLREAGAPPPAPRRGGEPAPAFPDPPTGARGRVMGIALAELTADLRARQELPDSVRGLLVISVDSGADAIGKLKPGDIITEMAFTPVQTIAAARDVAAAAAREGRSVLVQLRRDGVVTYRAVRP